MPKKHLMIKEKFIDSGKFNPVEFPLYKKVVELDENGDPHEHFEPMTAEEASKACIGSVFSDVGNGKYVPVPSFGSAFEISDALEREIDSMSDEVFAKLSGKSINQS